LTVPTLRLYVRNLTERADEQRLEQTIRGLKGVYAAIASSAGHCVEIDFEDDDVSIHQLVAALAEAGFDARVAS
jgi:copper chaperone CopZ